MKQTECDCCWMLSPLRWDAHRPCEVPLVKQRRDQTFSMVGWWGWRHEAKGPSCHLIRELFAVVYNCNFTMTGFCYLLIAVHLFAKPQRALALPSAAGVTVNDKQRRQRRRRHDGRI
ncbi:uncharacterized protein LOC115563347 [Drosophila navojoa]|uniref:uncharacterized protein LOC115563347 n=1 Tax=Drosophila navojoa TaxID=7232 RepID=UPI0011BF8545|nr:uncharacterized protein LOC115563347 [Drosophila navojoa]